MHSLCHERRVKRLFCKWEVIVFHKYIRRAKVMEEVELFKLKGSVDSNAKQCRNGKKKVSEFILEIRRLLSKNGRRLWNSH